MRLEGTLAAWLRAHPVGGIAVAYSGGGDSTALLAALAALAEARARGLRALHVDHGLAPDSEHWAAHCAALSERLGVPFIRLRAEVRAAGSGIEAAARRARYRLLGEALAPGEWLLLAHHAEDQAETILLRLLRGASPRLLAGMPALRPLGRGFLARPLLGLSRAVLRAELIRSRLPWIEDPANRDPRFDRSHLRRVLLPALAERYPHWAEGIAASGAMIAAATAVAERELARALLGEEAIVLAPLLAMPAAEAALGLELWLRRRGARPLPAARLAEFLRQLATARPDRAPVLSGHGWRLQRFRDRLHLLPEPLAALPAELDLAWDGAEPLALPDGSKLLFLGETPGPVAALRVRARRGGERIRLAPGRGRQAVKELLRSSALPPWERRRLPLLWEGARVVAVGERWLDPDFAARLAARGLRLRYRRPLAGTGTVE